MYIRILTLACLGLALSGCATIIKGTTQSLSVITPPAIWRTCNLQSSEGTWYVTTPGSVYRAQDARTILTYTCDEGWLSPMPAQSVEPHFNGATVGNVLHRRVDRRGLSMPQAARTYTYPEQITVPMMPSQRRRTGFGTGCRCKRLRQMGRRPRPSSRVDLEAWRPEKGSLESAIAFAGGASDETVRRHGHCRAWRGAFAAARRSSTGPRSASRSPPRR